MKELYIKENYNNKNIFTLLQKEFPKCSTACFQKLFRLKDIKVNGKWVDKKYLVKENDLITIYGKDEHLVGMVPSINYIYEDDNILVAFKPKWTISCNSINKNDLDFETLVRQNKRNSNLQICHRLDTNTEGLVIFSKSNKSHLLVLDAFKNSLIKKTYLVLVHSKPPKEHDILKHYILKDTTTNFSKIYESKVASSKECITEYFLDKYNKKKDISRLKVILHTGRTHQIRAHMKYLGTDVLGDTKYTKNEINKKYKYNTQMLLAYSYGFNFEENSPLYYLNKITITAQIPANYEI